ncbi:hypothetical protein JI739_05240 [Ramlibacter sp. AW1]|uniref:Rcc01698-like C-terminal domain-containing protein n=1 Tax=Ramlibacter aurantiacus TaxID=2801330 RepID=A0A936ZLZ8_9BURK|nr:hypothetical protein [Ramlibacter aurantiacus]MBL0419748.1 hypothetical protein [Ramlibacter aurantiacus]
MNINMLRDSDDDAGFYAAACGLATGWRGAALFQSSDAGATYSMLASLTGNATLGTVSNALGDFHGGNIPDELNSVTVVLAHGTLSSVPYASFINGAQVAVVGSEIVSFRDAALNGDGSYTLRGLLRGRRGSEYAMGAHVAGERFVLLNPETIARVAAGTAEIGMTRLYKAVTYGSSLAVTPAQSFTNEGMGLKPYAPVHLGGGRDAAGDLALNWMRRSRVSGEWRDAVDVPLGETTEAYDVEIWDSTYTTLKRTITGISAPTTVYTAVQQTADFGAPQSTVYFRVFQLSSIVGRGHAASGSV